MGEKRADTRRSRGWCAIGVEHIKTDVNLGTLWRSAVAFDAAFIFTIGHRFRREASDTSRSWRKIPALHYTDIDDFHAHIPYDVVPVGVEIVEESVPLHSYAHPDRAIYLLGPEDGSLSRTARSLCRDIVRIDTRYCLNVATAGSILLYDRALKRERARPVIVNGAPVPEWAAARPHPRTVRTPDLPDGVG